VVTDTLLPVVEGERAGWPVIHYDFGATRPLHGFYRELDELRERSPFYWSTYGPVGFWMIMRYEHVREAYQRYEVFSSDSIDPLDPDPAYRFIPTLVNPPDHVKYRQVLNAWFSPAGVARISPAAREVCVADIERIKEQGACDFIADFALLYPTEVFLRILGLPVSDAALFVPLVDKFFVAFYGEDKSPIGEVAGAIQGYFSDLLAERRKRPGDPAVDFVTYLLGASVFDRPLSDQEILDICFVLVLAGLDTTRGQSGYLFHHLATHDDDRHRVAADPELVKSAVEETLRLYTIIIGDGRKIAQDADFYGVPLKRGEMAWLSVAGANRDPRAFEDPTTFKIDRYGNKHLGFAGGPHRCLGAHLARQEMAIAVEEWHRRIPDYRLAPGGAVEERGGMLTLFSLPLEWDV
jgi:cytochrome P450